MAPRAIDLDGVYRKIERAELHAETFRDKLATFLKSDPKPLGIRTDRHPGAGKSVNYTIYAVIREMPSSSFGPIMGDIVHNLRSALDHLIYQLASTSVRKRRQIQFPIYADECSFRVGSRRDIQGIRGDERTHIERVQPWFTTKPPRNDPLAILHTLSNLDKHNLLLTTIAGASDTESWIAYDNAIISEDFFEPGQVQDGTPIFGFNASPEDPTIRMNVNAKSGLEIRIKETGAIGYTQTATETMDMLCHHVRHTVIDRWFKYGHLPPDEPKNPCR